MKRILKIGLLVVGLGLIHTAQAQTNADTLIISKDTLAIDTVQVKEDVKVYEEVDINANFKGGEDSLREFVVSNFMMPRTAMELSVSGLVMIQFIIEKNGNISDVKSLMPEARQLGYGLEAECLRVLNLTNGKWIPAQIDGKPVRSNFRFPFQVDNSSGFERTKKKRKRRK